MNLTCRAFGHAWELPSAEIVRRDDGLVVARSRRRCLRCGAVEQMGDREVGRAAPVVTK